MYLSTHMESAVSVITQSVIYLLDYFRKIEGNENALMNIPADNIGEHVSRRLVLVYDGLVRADAESRLYLMLIANDKGPHYDMLVMNDTQLFFERIRGYITIVKTNFNRIGSIIPDAMQAVKGYAGIITNQDYGNIKIKMTNYDQIINSGGRLNNQDVTSYLQILQDFTRYYIVGVSETLEDFPFSGRNLLSDSNPSKTWSFWSQARGRGHEDY